MAERMGEEESENWRSISLSSSSSSSSWSEEHRRRSDVGEVALTVDWRGRPCNPNKHYGGMKAAVFVLGLQALEMMAIAGVGNNLITYVFNDMHFSLSKSANIVTNFVGTIFLLSLLGGFLSDSYLGTFSTIFIFSLVELFGLILLAIQAHFKQLRAAECKTRVRSSDCEEAKGYEKVVFFVAIYLVALGSGCLKPNIIAHGAIQFNNGGAMKKQLSSYFNAAYFAFCVGEIVALTLFVWIQTHSGMDVGFGVSAAAMALALLCFVSATPLYRNTIPTGSIFTPIVQVFVAAFSKRKQICPSSSNITPNNVQNNHNSLPATNNDTFQITNKFRFLDKACMKEEEDETRNQRRRRRRSVRICSLEEVEQVKRLVCVMPIFGSTIIFNTISAQLQTFSVQQASAMDTRLFSTSFRLPPPSLQSIPYLLLLLLLPLYHAAAARLRSSAVSPLRRVAAGLLAATFSMVAAALVEAKRRRRRRSHDALPVLWIAPQFLIFGVSEMLAAVGLIEFFYSQSLDGMRSFLTAVTYCSYSFGFYFSSVLVSLVDRLTAAGDGGGGGWLGNDDLDDDRLDLFYWVLAALSLLNFFNYLFWSNWYSSLQRSPVTSTTTVDGQLQQYPESRINYDNVDS